MPATNVLLADDPVPGVRRPTMNRPEKRNALNNELRGAILAALEQADSDPAVKVSILRGAGLSFSAGHDLSANNAVDQRYDTAGGAGQWARHVAPSRPRTSSARCSRSRSGSRSSPPRSLTAALYSLYTAPRDGHGGEVRAVATTGRA